MSKSSVNHALAKLEQRGFLTRKRFDRLRAIASREIVKESLWRGRSETWI
jgi:hypothetical protein